MGVRRSNIWHGANGDAVRLVFLLCPPRPSALRALMDNADPHRRLSLYDHRLSKERQTTILVSIFFVASGRVAFDKERNLLEHSTCPSDPTVLLYWLHPPWHVCGACSHAVAMYYFAYLSTAHQN